MRGGAGGACPISDEMKIRQPKGGGGGGGGVELFDEICGRGGGLVTGAKENIFPTQWLTAAFTPLPLHA